MVESLPSMLKDLGSTPSIVEANRKTKPNKLDKPRAPMLPEHTHPACMASSVSPLHRTLLNSMVRPLWTKIFKRIASVKKLVKPFPCHGSLICRVTAIYTVPALCLKSYVQLQKAQLYRRLGANTTAFYVWDLSIKVCVCVHVCICMGIYTYIHVCGCTWMYVHVEVREWLQVPLLFFKGHLFCLLRHDLTVTWNLPTRLGYLASGSQRPICLHFPGLRAIGTRYEAWILKCESWGLNLGSHALGGKHVTN